MRSSSLLPEARELFFRSSRSDIVGGGAATRTLNKIYSNKQILKLNVLKVQLISKRLDKKPVTSIYNLLFKLTKANSKCHSYARFAI